MHQQLWGYKVEEKLYLGLREQKRLNITALKDVQYIGNMKRTVNNSGNFIQAVFGYVICDLRKLTRKNSY
jgi:hypothetical protein